MSKSKSTATDTESAAHSVRLEHLEKARLLASWISCTIEFIDFSDDSTEIIEGDYAEAYVTKDQMRGIFLVTALVSARLMEIRQLVHEYALHEKEYPEITSMIDDAISMIDAGLRVANIHFSREIYGYQPYSSEEVALNRSWVNGFFNTLKFVDERLYLLFEDINHICSRFEEAIKPNNGGDSGSHLH